MPSISTWKINNQIADLRDGTKGQPNGAVPLNAQGKIDKSLLKAYADDIKVRVDDPRTLAEYVSAMKVGMLSLPLTYTDAETTVNTEKKTCVEGYCDYVFTPTGWYTYNHDSKQLSKYKSLSFSSISKAIWFKPSNSAYILMMTNSGFYYFYQYINEWSGASLSSTLITKFDIDKLHYVGRAVASAGVLKVADLASSITEWQVDSTWPSARYAYNVFFCNNKWFVCGDSVDYGNILYEYNGVDTWQPHTDLVGRDWTGMLWIPYKSAYIIWSNTEIWIKTEEQLHWWQFSGINNDTIIYTVAYSNSHIVVATSKGLYYSDLSDCIAIPTHRPVLSFVSISLNRPCYTVTYKNNLWFVSAQSGILYSFDAINWFYKVVDTTLLFTSAVALSVDRWLLLPEPNPDLPAAQLRCKAKLSNIQCVSKPIYL